MRLKRAILLVAVASAMSLAAHAQGAGFVGPVDMFNVQSMYLSGHFLGPVDMLSGTTGDRTTENSGSGLIISSGTTTYAGGTNTLFVNNFNNGYDGGSLTVGANSYTGSTTLNGGTLGYTGGAGTLFVNNNGVTTSGTINVSSLSALTGTTVTNGALTGATLNLTANQGLIQTGTGNLILNSTANSPIAPYTLLQFANGTNFNTTFPSATGTTPTVVINGGALRLNSPELLLGKTLVVNVPTALTFSQGTLDLSGAGVLDSNGNETLTVVQSPDGNGPVILPLLPGTYDVTDPTTVTDPTILTDGSGAVVGQLDSGSDPSSTDAGSGDASGGDGTGAGLSVSAVPEPAGVVLAGCGLAALVFARRRMNRQGR